LLYYGYSEARDEGGERVGKALLVVVVVIVVIALAYMFLSRGRRRS
jgi:ABC-type sugar transport system permease subunit